MSEFQTKTQYVLNSFVLTSLLLSSLVHAQDQSIGFTQSEYRVNEGAPVRVFIRRTDPSFSFDGEISADLEIREGTGPLGTTAGVDFTRGNGRDPLDFGATYGWEDGQFYDRANGELRDIEKNIEIITLPDGIVGEGNETLSVTITNVTGGSIGEISTTTIVIEDDTTVDNCTSPAISRFVGWDFSRQEEAANDSFRLNSSEEPDGALILSASLDSNAGYSFGLLAVANSCTESVRYSDEGQPGENEAAFLFSQLGERYYLISGGEGEYLYEDFLASGGADCSDVDDLCHQRSISATPFDAVAGSGAVTRQVVTYVEDISDGLQCPINAITKEEYRDNLASPGTSAFEFYDSCTTGFVQQGLRCVSTSTVESYALRAQLGVPYNAANIGSSAAPMTVNLGDTVSLQLMNIATRTDVGSRPPKNEMGVSIYREQGRGVVSTGLTSGTSITGGEWFSTTEPGVVLYTADRVGSDRFQFVIVPPSVSGGFNQDGQDDGYNHCFNSKGQVFLEVLAAQPVNQNPVVSVSTGSLSLEAGDQGSVTVSTSDPNNDQVSVSTSSSSTSVATVSGPGTAGSFTINAVSVGTATITFAANDGNGGSDSSSVTVTVTEVPPVNQNPVVSVSTGLLSLQAGDQGSVTVSTSDPNNDPVSVSTSSSDSAIASVAGPDSLGNYIVSGITEGTATVTFNGNDGNGGNATASLSVTVAAAEIPLSDIDGDGVSDTVDNCPETVNSNQLDADTDGVGDVCDVDPNGILTDNTGGSGGGSTDIAFLLLLLTYMALWHRRRL